MSGNTKNAATYAVLLIAAIGSLQYGYHLSELNAPQDVITCKKDSVFARWAGLPRCIPMTEAAYATISSMFTLGGFFGALATGPLSTRLGRRPTMRLAALFYTAGSLVATFSPWAPLMSFGRFLGGLAAGSSTVNVPLYISEIAPPDSKGLFGAMTQISINVGILATQTLGYFLSHGSQWRWILAAGGIIGIAQGLGCIVIAESPAWLAGHNLPKAEKTLRRIRPKGYDITAEVESWSASTRPTEEPTEEDRLLDYQNDAAVPEETTKPERPSTVGFIQVVRDPVYRPAILAVVGVMCAQQACGINSIIMYSVSLLNNLLPISSAVLTIFISLANLISTLVFAPLPDKLGRKTCLLLSIAGQGTSSLVLALSIVFGVKILSAIAVLFFVAFFGVGLGPVPFMLPSELVGKEAVGAAQSWALGASYIATFLVAQFFPIVNRALNDALGGAGWVYFIFTGLAFFSAIFVWWKVPETKDKELSEVWN